MTVHCTVLLQNARTRIVTRDRQCIVCGWLRPRDFVRAVRACIASKVLPAVQDEKHQLKLQAEAQAYEMDATGTPEAAQLAFSTRNRYRNIDDQASSSEQRIARMRVSSVHGTDQTPIFVLISQDAQEITEPKVSAPRKYDTRQ